MTAFLLPAYVLIVYVFFFILLLGEFNERIVYMSKIMLIRGDILTVVERIERERESVRASVQNVAYDYYRNLFSIDLALKRGRSACISSALKLDNHVLLCYPPRSNIKRSSVRLLIFNST